MAKVTLTTAGSHVAARNGYAEGRIIETGEPVPAGIPVADISTEGESGMWMTEADAPAPEEAPAAE